MICKTGTQTLGIYLKKNVAVEVACNFIPYFNRMLSHLTIDIGPATLLWAKKSQFKLILLIVNNSM